MALSDDDKKILGNLRDMYGLEKTRLAAIVLALHGLNVLQAETYLEWALKLIKDRHRVDTARFIGLVVQVT